MVAALSLTVATASADPTPAPTGTVSGSIKVTGPYHVSAAQRRCVLISRVGVLQVHFGSTGLEFTIPPHRDFHNLNLARSHAVTAMFLSGHKEWVAGIVGRKTYGPGSMTVSDNGLSGHLTATMHPVSLSANKVLTSVKPIHVVAHWTNCTME